MHSFQADPDVEETLLLVLEATGAPLRDLVNEALRAHFAKFVQDRLKARRDAEEALLRQKGLGHLLEPPKKPPRNGPAH